MDPIVLAFLVTLGAGLATGLGSLLAFTRKTPSDKFIAFMLGLSAGVMIYVSLVEIFQKAVGSLTDAFGDGGVGYMWATIGFFGGFIIIAVIDYFFDYYHNRELPETETGSSAEKSSAEVLCAWVCLWR
jgi:zinc transporter, ZIP family